MKFNFKHNVELNAQTDEAKEQAQEKDGRGNWMIALAITFLIAITISVYVAVRIDINYTWSNQPKIERNTGQ